MIGFIFLILALSFTLIFYFRNFALQKSIIDIPNERSSHIQPTPRGGGVVFVGIFYVLLTVLWLVHQIKAYIFYAFLGGVPVALVGYCDDIYGVKIYWRFLVHLASSMWCVAMLGLMHSFSGIVPVVLIVWFINFYNFMDGIDGIAATQGVFVTAVAGVMLFLKNHIGMSFLCFGVLAALIGFLYWNWQPAKIFMGDVGSGFLGFFFGTLMFSTAIEYKIPVIFWFILMAVFLCDAGCTLLYRIFKKKKWYMAHREHVYQRMVQFGWEHSQVVLLVVMIDVFFLLPAALLFLNLQNLFIQIIVSLTLVTMIVMSWIFAMRKFSV